MDALEAESFALSFSDASDAEFDAMEWIPGFNMPAFTTTLQRHKDEVAGDLCNMLLTFTDFLAFKEIGLVVTSLCKSSSVPASQNNLQP
ncbi:hypothetical protein JEQ12_017237 [Ovis aries]|uniref:ADP-ribosylation factor-like protein 2-binding protein n=1 Tax=Ovis aries TaxID=9940 RepID=A0A836A462_SHEEP|nr:hypothetical protein JEQ12_017237 [Ovis aries]